jgi:hypothetical protein
MKDLIDLRLRKHYAGGPVTKRARATPLRNLFLSREIILLIHGFNVTLCEAGCSYENFIEFHQSDRNFSMMRVFWPGDAALFGAGHSLVERRGKIRFGFSAVTYPIQIGAAEQSAQRIAEALGQLARIRRRPPRTIVVAHSLGCRLTLEVLERLSEQGTGWRPELVALMAAAVARHEVMPGGKFHRGVQRPKRIVAFHSEKDKALGLIFRTGQVIETVRDWMFHRRFGPNSAIGRWGMPDAGLGTVQNVRVVGADHGHYWPAAQIANCVYNGAQGREITVRKLPAEMNKGYELGRNVPARQPYSRVVGAQRGICRSCAKCEKE